MEFDLLLSNSTLPHNISIHFMYIFIFVVNFYFTATIHTHTLARLCNYNVNIVEAGPVCETVFCLLNRRRQTGVMDYLNGISCAQVLYDQLCCGYTLTRIPTHIYTPVRTIDTHTHTLIHTSISI